MQIQCPQCNGWTDTESNICNLCGAPLGLTSQSTDNSDIHRDTANIFEQNQLDHNRPIDLNELIQSRNTFDYQALLRNPNQKVIFNGQEMTMAEWKKLSEERGREATKGCLKLLAIVVAILLIPVFLYFIGSC